jgi:hypothetical protein
LAVVALAVVALAVVALAVVALAVVAFAVGAFAAVVFAVVALAFAGRLPSELDFVAIGGLLGPAAAFGSRSGQCRRTPRGGDRWYTEARSPVRPVSD